jgi:CheY-like chemotaxis protein
MQLAPDLGLLKADAGQLEQVIMNLVINARDAMSEGGTLTITTANVAKREPAALQYPSRQSAPLAHMSNSREQSPAITLIISDTGMGMNASTRSRIFEPFYTTKGIGKGTGLGLAIVHGIVTQSDGHISVDSEPGCGAAFTICLPRTDASAEEVSSVDPPALDIHKAATILLVEDDLIVRTLAGRILRKQGYHIIEAGDGPTALQAVATYQEQIHVLLTDVGIPGGINGYQLAEQITALHPMIKVLYMSGYAEPALSQSHMVAHHSFVEKPFTPAKLAHTVSIAIRELSL